MQLYLERIEAYDKRGPRLNAILQINQRAAEIARALDAERSRTARRGPLHGIPIAVKDNIDVSATESGRTKRRVGVLRERVAGRGRARRRPPTTPPLPADGFAYQAR